MTPSKIVGVAAALALAAAGVGLMSGFGDEPEVELTDVAITKDGRKIIDVGAAAQAADEVKGDETAVDSKTIAAADLSASKLGMLSDGGLAAYVEIDGGMVVLDKFPCVRRRAGSAPDTCLRKTEREPVNGEDFGELNRFPASEVGNASTDCEPVACSIWLGDSP